MHVFIKHGLQYFYNKEKPSTISVLEIGFGTGLNALLTYLIAKEISELHVNYTGLEAYPVAIKEIEKLNFSEQLEIDKSIYTKLHTCAWEKKEAISNRFNLKKLNIRFEEFIGLGDFDLIYFDAFGPRVSQNCGRRLFLNKCLQL